MKIVKNADFGGFGYGVAKKFNEWIRDFAAEGKRTDPELVAFVEEHPAECGDLVVVEIPDTATDWQIDEYDGLETVIYVVDGKIHRA